MGARNAGRKSPSASAKVAAKITRVRNPAKVETTNWDSPVQAQSDGNVGARDHLAVGCASSTAAPDSSGIGQTPEWYTKALNYWTAYSLAHRAKPATVAICDSIGDAFIEEYVSGPTPRLQRGLVLDCGAGIGRVTKEFLLQVFEKGDLVEVNPKFVEEAKRNVPADRVERFICCGLQEFVPEAGRYDAIWVQWVLGHLNDADFVTFFQRCKLGLKPSGIIFVKENACKAEQAAGEWVKAVCTHLLCAGFILDDEDSSMTRSDALMRSLFDKAGLTILKGEIQTDFPPEIFAVHMYGTAPGQDVWHWKGVLVGRRTDDDGWKAGALSVF